MFGQTKKWLRRHRESVAQDEVLAIFAAAASITPEDARAYFRSCHVAFPAENEGNEQEMAAAVLTVMMTTTNALLADA